MWAHPLAAKAGPDGIELSSAPPAASTDHILTPFVPDLAVGGPSRSLEVAGYGAFDVQLRSLLVASGTLDTVLVQGSPLAYFQWHGAQPVVAVTGSAPDVSTSRIGSADVARVNVGGRQWELVAPGDGRWQRQGSSLTLLTSDHDPRLAVAAVPSQRSAAWESAVMSSAANPVVTTSSTMSYESAAGVVRQTTRMVRARPGGGLWTLLPHQGHTLEGGPGVVPIPGTYADALGDLTMVNADSVSIRVPLSGFAPGVPSVPVSSGAKDAVRRDLDADLAQPSTGGGSYLGLKELGRLASVAEVAQAVGDDDVRRQVLDRLRAELVDWLTYSGPGDGRYFAYDSRWGGLIGVPAEFGAQDYNDHNFQYGYLVRAAAVMAQADPTFLRQYGPVVNLIVRDYAGTGGRDASFPSDRSFAPYLGHSLASGYANFADGNNQESSSEALAAWEAAARWGMVSGQPDLVTLGVTRYALEAETARDYWLGALPRPDGYGHQVAGIVWDAKVDFATFFDPRPESVQGIQLLPLTFGDFYRADPAAAGARAAELARETGGLPREWGDLFAADLAAADPGVALARLSPSLPTEPSTSRALVRYWIESLATLGPPAQDVRADAPFGIALRNGSGLHLVGANPSGKPRVVTFRRGDNVVGTLSLAPGQSRTVETTVP